MNYSLNFLLSIIFLSYASITASGQLIINEVVACNDSIPVDGFGGTPDWIEIFNYSENEVDMNEYFLSDKKSEPQKWQFPKTKLASKAYLVVYASGEDISNPIEIHTNFKIDAEGETIRLSNKDSVISEVKVPEIACNYSYGYLNNYEDSLVIFTNSTLGASNNEGQLKLELIFSHESGFYEDSFALNISTLDDAEIRYTLNTALEPTKNSNLYTAALSLTNRIGDLNILSEIPTTDTSAWKKPKEEVFKSNIIRAAAFVDGEQVSDVFTKSYAITPLGNERYSFPVISLVADPGDFFSDSTGIYVLGDNYVENQLPNFDYDWERDVFVEYFEKDGQAVISQNAQIEIAGKTTRWRRQKSLKLKAEGKLNKNRFEYNFFNTDIDEYKTLILKTSLADYRKSFIKDELLNELAEKINLADADSEPVIVFLNGEYWGIHILQERQDKYYFEDHFDVDKDSINLLEGNATEEEIIEGTNLEYLQLRDYAINNNLNEQQHFDSIAKHINIDNYIDYYSFQMLVATRDWPWNNIKYWRPADNSRKWEWFPVDFDSSYNYPETNSFEIASKPANESVAWSVLLYNNLMESDYFNSRLFTRLEELLNNEFCADSIVPLIDKYKNKYEPEIEEHLQRWNFEDDYSWKDELEIYYNFPTILAYVLQQIAKEDYEYEIATCDTFITSINESVELNNTLFNIHPNPASNYLNIQYKSSKKAEQLYITGITGDVILEVNVGQSPQYLLDIGALPAGVYFVCALNNDRITSKKFIKLY